MSRMHRAIFARVSLALALLLFGGFASHSWRMRTEARQDAQRRAESLVSLSEGPTGCGILRKWEIDPNSHWGTALIETGDQFGPGLSHYRVRPERTDRFMAGAIVGHNVAFIRDENHYGNETTDYVVLDDRGTYEHPRH